MWKIDYTRYWCLTLRKPRVLQPRGSTMYWLKIQWWSRMNYNRISTWHYSRKRRRWFYQWTDRYDQWNNTSYISVEKDKAGRGRGGRGPTPLILTIIFSISQRLNKMGNQRHEMPVISESSSKLNFCSGKRYS